MRNCARRLGAFSCSQETQRCKPRVMAGVSRRTFVCLRGISWGPNGCHAYEPGDLIRDLPSEYVPWMLEQGLVREAASADLESDGT